MSELYPIFFAAIVLVILSVLEILFFKYLNRRWWRKPLIRRASYILPVGGLVSIVVWTLGLMALKKTVMIIGSFATGLCLVLIFALLMSLPVAGVFNFIYDYLERRRKPDHETEDETLPSLGRIGFIPRRRFLKAAAAIAPAVALSSGISGVAQAFSPARVYVRQLVVPGLPQALEGIRILHITDIHIGYYIWPEHVAALLGEAERFSPDIILATGDLSDRLGVYGELLQMLYDFEAPLGVYASLGNHEYYRGIHEVMHIFGQSPVPLLLNQGMMLEIDGQPFFLAGLDDPRFLSHRNSDFFTRSLDMTLRDRPEGAFTVLMSHRPDAFDAAAERGVDVILAGHTHGSQVGWSRRSVFEPMLPGKYLWGEYKIGDSRLYTSAGVGHWFPFRLGCPAEAPILELRSV